MKKLTITLLSVLCILCILFSCKKNIETTTDISSTNNGYSKTVEGNTIVHKLTINGSTRTIVEKNGEFYISDDMLIYKSQFEDLKKHALSGTIPRALVTTIAAGNTNGTWPDGIVYFEYPKLDSASGLHIDSGLTALQKINFDAAIDKALNQITDSTGIIFKKRTNQVSHLQFMKANTNDAYFGFYMTMRNPVRIASNYLDSVKVIMHETLHALGVKHEHQRSDRNNYLKINEADVLKDFNGFVIDDTRHIVDASYFDFESIMLYSNNIGCKSGKSCMTKLNGDTLLHSSNKRGLSAGDAIGLRYLYPTAAARMINGEYKIQSSTDATKFLYTNSTSSFVTTASVAYPNNHKYQFIRTGNIYQIKPVQQAGKALAVNAGQNQIVLENASSDAENQKFKLVWKDVNTFSVIPVVNETLRLNFGSSNVSIQLKNDATTNQTIKLVKFE